MYHVFSVTFSVETAAKIVKPFKALKVKETHEAQLNVILDKPNQTVIWLKNGQEISSSESIQVR